MCNVPSVLLKDRLQPMHVCPKRVQIQSKPLQGLWKWVRFLHFGHQLRVLPARLHAERWLVHFILPDFHLPEGQHLY
jgi:hypothetical protein